MNKLNVFAYEWKHFTRLPFKVIAIILYMLAGFYGLYNGYALYEAQTAEIERIEKKSYDEMEEQIALWDKGLTGPQNRPWVDYQKPYWAILTTATYDFKVPSSAMVYSVGQAEQYGFYKKVDFWASPYDTDMAEEIANPERIQKGTLDYGFVLLYLLPLLLLILVYNINGAESEQGILPLIKVQVNSINSWTYQRTSFYVILAFLANFILIIVGALMTDVFSTSLISFGKVTLLMTGYLLFWALIYYFIIRRSKSILDSTLKMIGFWLLFTFLFPSAVHQWISIQKPANLMTDLIDAKRDGKSSIFEQDAMTTKDQLTDLYPEIANTFASIVKDNSRISEMTYDTDVALVNDLLKTKITQIEKNNMSKNRLISNTYFMNPVAFFQNSLNSITKTHYNDYHDFRTGIQVKIDRQINDLVLDTWNEVKVDKEKYLNYYNLN